MSPISHVLIVGSGLMGASVGLAAREAGLQVRILDKDAQRVLEASQSTGLEVHNSDFIPDLIVIATPPEQTPVEIDKALRMFPQSTVIDIASIKTQVLNEVDTNQAGFSRFVPTHPMAGKESSGFEHASFDLFKDRIWVVCPLDSTNPDRITLVKEFIESLGALPFEMSALEHDRTVAITSHVPQVVASVLAAQLLDLTDSHVQVSGQGLRDMTRIASSNPQLWSEILLANAAFVGPLLAKISTELAAVAQSLSSRSPEEISSAISRGNQGRALVPGKHGDKPTLYETVSIMIQDAPGQLAAIFAVADQAEVNVEDVRIDHALGKAVAIVELDVDPAKALSLREALISQGWTLRNNPHS